ncbi:MAG: hypothetical protein R3E93_14130 [Thiothrix sp.]
MTGMNKEFTERLLAESVRQGMDQSVRGLDWQTQAKLTYLRLQVLEQSGRSSGSFGFSSFSRGFAVASAVTLAVALWVLPNVRNTLPGSMLTAGEDATETVDAELDISTMEVLMSGEDMDFLENLEMYEWLEAEYG